VENNSKGLRVRNFFDIEAKEIMERYRVIETLLPNTNSKGAYHRGEEGRYIESLLRSFLNSHLPSNLKAMSGFILSPSTKTGIEDNTRVENYPDRHSRQLDIIVYDVANYPIYEKFEEFCIVPPEGVVSIISVKKKLKTNDIHHEAKALRDAATLCSGNKKRTPHTAIFSFDSDIKTLRGLNAKIFLSISKENGGSFSTLINEVIVANKTCIFKLRKDNTTVEGHAQYVGVDCTKRPHITLQRILQSILSVHYDTSRGSRINRPGFVSFEKNTFADSPKIGTIPYDYD
jgi:hypothetical protein